MVPLSSTNLLCCPCQQMVGHVIAVLEVGTEVEEHHGDAAVCIHAGHFRGQPQMEESNPKKRIVWCVAGGTRADRKNPGRTTFGLENLRACAGLHALAINGGSTVHPNSVSCNEARNLAQSVQEGGGSVVKSRKCESMLANIIVGAMLTARRRLSTCETIAVERIKREAWKPTHVDLFGTETNGGADRNVIGKLYIRKFHIAIILTLVDILRTPRLPQS